MQQIGWRSFYETRLNKTKKIHFAYQIDNIWVGRAKMNRQKEPRHKAVFFLINKADAELKTTGRHHACVRFDQI